MNITIIINIMIYFFILIIIIIIIIHLIIIINIIICTIEHVAGLVGKLIITVQTNPIYLPRSPPNIAIEQTSNTSSQSIQKAYT